MVRQLLSAPGAANRSVVFYVRICGEDVSQQMPNQPRPAASTTTEGLEALAETFERHPDESIVPRRSLDTSDQRAFALLAQLSESGAVPSNLQVESMLGTGGMGIVMLATQRTLGRRVAVKTLREEHASQEARVELVREAWVTGQLEHPNVVPIYDLGVDAKGAPIIVLKRIEGIQWAELLRRPEWLRTELGVHDPFEWHLRTLMQVANAVRFAHRRRIIHRDLKPQNVMIGSFGEVYVLDWGIAVSLDEKGTTGWPPRQRPELAGTPAYMAPEMLDGIGLSERTDIYLLGAILFELVTGRPPHRGSTFNDMVASIRRGTPQVPAAVPSELARILERALAQAPAERFETVELLLRALEDFLRHLGSTSLARQAEEKLDLLLASFAGTAGTSSSERQRQHRHHLYHLFGECRFGFKEALRSWPDNPVAALGFRRATVAMIEFELQRDDAPAAALLLPDLDAPGELRGRVESAVAAAEQREQARRALERSLDPRVGGTSRLIVTALFGLIWSIVPLGGQVLADRLSYSLGIAVVASALVTAGVAGTFLRRLLQTTFNRTVVGGGLAAMACQLGLFVWGAGGAIPLERTMGLSFVPWGAIIAMMALSLEPRLAYGAVGCLLAFLAALRWPSAVWVIASLTNAMLTAICIWVWLLRPSTRPADPD
jgi:serine/threonine protein kinase